MLILYGASGHGKVILEILEANGVNPNAIWDDADKDPLWDYAVVKPAYDLIASGGEMIISIGDNRIRKMIAERNMLHFEFVKAIHPQAVISSRAVTGAGTVVMAGVVINSDAVVGDHCIINTGAVIEHECLIEDYVHISPNATLCGNVRIGEGTHVGAGAVIIPGVAIGRWCTVGAGAVVIRDIPDGITVVGNPGRAIKQLAPIP